MKQDHYWQKGETAPRHGVFSRIVGAALFVISAFIFMIASNATSAQVQGVLDILGVGLISLSLTLLITGWTVDHSNNEDDSRS